MRDVRQQVLLNRREASIKKMMEMLEDRKGSQEEALAGLKASKECLEMMIRHQEQAKSSHPVKREQLFGKDGFFAQDGMVILKEICGDEYPSYRKLIIETSVMPSAMKEEYIESVWNDFLDANRVFCSIYSKETNGFVGYCGIKEADAKDLELAIELLGEYHGQGFGYHALCVYMDNILGKTGKCVYRARVDTDNYASQALFEKLGGMPNGISEFLLHGEELLHEAEEQYTHLIDSRLCGVAEKFGVEPKKLLSHVLEYKIVWAGKNPSSKKKKREKTVAKSLDLW